MNVNGRLKAALDPLGLPWEMDAYTGTAPVYLTAGCDTVAVQFADDMPLFERALVQVHLVAPLGMDTVDLRIRVLRALLAQGFGYAQVVNATQRETQHYIFECECITERMKENG